MIEITQDFQWNDGWKELQQAELTQTAVFYTFGTINWFQKWRNACTLTSFTSLKKIFLVCSDNLHLAD